MIFNTLKGYFVTCCVVLAKSMTNLICPGKLLRIKLHLPGDTSNYNARNAMWCFCQVLGAQQCSDKIFTAFPKPSSLK